MTLIAVAVVISTKATTTKVHLPTVAAIVHAKVAAVVHAKVAAVVHAKVATIVHAKVAVVVREVVIEVLLKAWSIHHRLTHRHHITIVVVALAVILASTVVFVTS